MMVRRKMVPATHERLPVGWTLSPAYPGRLGAAGSVLIKLRYFSRIFYFMLQPVLARPALLLAPISFLQVPERLLCLFHHC